MNYVVETDATEEELADSGEDEDEIFEGDETRLSRLDGVEVSLQYKHKLCLPRILYLLLLL